MEERFFFLYNFQIEPCKTDKIPILDRKWFIDRYVVQKEREAKAYESRSKK